MVTWRPLQAFGSFAPVESWSSLQPRYTRVPWQTLVSGKAFLSFGALQSPVGWTRGSWIASVAFAAYESLFSFPA